MDSSRQSLKTTGKLFSNFRIIFRINYNFFKKNNGFWFMHACVQAFVLISTRLVNLFPIGPNILATNDITTLMPGVAHTDNDMEITKLEGLFAVTNVRLSVIARLSITAAHCVHQRPCTALLRCAEQSLRSLHPRTQ